MNECSNSVDVIYLDLRKAFDSVSHLKLLHKLKFYSINGQLLCWFKSYLSIDGNVLELIDQLQNYFQCYPVSQSILEPLLFILYINDLPGCLSTTTPFSFADDTKILELLKIQASGDERLMQKDIQALAAWSTKWSLKFNPNKCGLLRWPPQMWPPGMIQLRQTTQGKIPCYL